jgi:hypothetical protein
MNVNRVFSIPNGSTPLTTGQRVSLQIQGGVLCTIPAGTAAGAIGTVLRDVAAGAAPTIGTVANGLGTYSTTDIFSPGIWSWGVADGVIAAGSAVYGQINGGVTATPTGAQIGWALSTTAVAGDILEWISIPFI